MTTNTQKPYNDLVADGSQTIFTYTFSIVETFDLLIIVEGVLQVLNTSYTLSNITDAGGEVVFGIAPLSGSRVLILRRTTISQNVDYNVFAGFPAETHEFNLDKITYIIQELVNGAFGGLDSDGNTVVLSFDLSVTADETTLTINNSGGTDALLPTWVSGSTAGVYQGEIGTAPPNGSVTTKPDGHVWIEV